MDGQGNLVIPLIIMFVVACVVLLVSTQILGSVTAGFSCQNLQGYNSTGVGDVGKYPAGSWSGMCKSVSTNAISGMTLMVVILIIIAAIAILVVVRSFAY